MNNMPALTINALISKLSKSYCGLINAGLPLTNMPSVMLWGPPGVGKSQAIRELSDEIEKNTDKKVKITDVRLLLFNPIDLRGIPTANNDKTLAVWLKPQIFDMDSDTSVVNILFLDEITAAPQSVQAAAYQITLDRVIGEHRLPDNCIVIAAGNRVTDKSVAYKMPKALANRLMHFEIRESFEDWKKWAVANGINAKVLGFLSFRQSYLVAPVDNSEDMAYTTPRSWEMVSRLLNSLGDDVEEMFDMIAGLVGLGTAIEFRTWSKVYEELPDVGDIFAGKETVVPRNADSLYALTASMTAYAREHQNDLESISRSIQYANRMPPDFSVVLMKDYMALSENYRETLLEIPEFVSWLRTKGKMLNGNI